MPIRFLSANKFILVSLWLFTLISIGLSYLLLTSYHLKFLPQFESSSPSSDNHTTFTTKKEQHNTYPFTFAACLIIKDGNILLPEWLAYHYTVLPLRHLIIAVDPLSKTSPMPIVDAFREELPDLTMEIWTGNSYIFPFINGKEKVKEFNPKNHTDEEAHRLYLKRQNSFYTACLRHLKKDDRKKNHTWAVLFDTDEYLVFNNPYSFENNVSTNNFPSLLRQSLPNYVGAQNETIAHWMYSNHQESSACMSFTRQNIQSKVNFTQAEQDDLSASSVPSSNLLFPVEKFNTLQYRTYTHPKKQLRLNGKSMVHIQRYNEFGARVTNPHRPLGKGNCRWYHYDESPLKFYQYTGAIDTYCIWGGKTYNDWRERNSLEIIGEDLTLSKWLHHFVYLAGKRAAHLLTVELRDKAVEVAKEIKHRETVLNEIIPPIFEYDLPAE